MPLQSAENSGAEFGGKMLGRYQNLSATFRSVGIQTPHHTLELPAQVENNEFRAVISAAYKETR